MLLSARDHDGVSKGMLWYCYLHGQHFFCSMGNAMDEYINAIKKLAFSSAYTISPPPPAAAESM